MGHFVYYAHIIKKCLALSREGLYNFVQSSVRILTC